MATILWWGVDLFIRGKLEALLPEHRFTTSDGVEPPDLVVADIARIDAEDVAESYPDVPILGYTNHTDTAGLRRAHAAGFDRVIVKSALFERTRELIEGLIASYGVKTFAELENQACRVLTDNGFQPALVKRFRRKPLVKIGLAPAFE